MVLDPLERVRRTLLYSRHISLKDQAALAKINPFHEITHAATDTRQRVRIPMWQARLNDQKSSTRGRET